MYAQGEQVRELYCHEAFLIADEIEDDSPCPICQASLRCEGISQSNVPKRLPCGHIFHLSCVVRWITHNQGKCVACPMCRTQLQTTKEAFSCWQVTVASAIEWWMECPWQLVCGIIFCSCQLLLMAEVVCIVVRSLIQAPRLSC